jgi:hypothetical protein
MQAQHLMNTLEDLAEKVRDEEVRGGELEEIFQRDPGLAEFAEEITEKFGGMKFN